ncbi:MAG: DnaJ domain-containing protein [Deltaproteobacteria bacterium]|nr:DnaJ domain-containing protein [Deltaproteobacteria bacterium]
MKDFYSILGISRGATAAEIKNAYRRLAKKYHPDVNKGDKSAEEKFKEISEAYNVLSDAERRKKYDLFGDAADHAGFGGRQEPDMGDFMRFENAGDLGDLFRDLFNMGGMRQEPFREEHRGRARSEAVKGQDTIVDLEIGFTEAIHGTERQLSIRRGNSTEKINVKIPAGVDNGSKVRVVGKGQPGFGGGKDGDLFLHLRVSAHPEFWREDADIYTEVPITVYDAILGNTVEVPTLSGTARMKIPEGTESGQKFRLAEKGAPALGKKGKLGDQYVIVRIVPPKKLDATLRTRVEELAEKFPYDPRQK